MATYDDWQKLAAKEVKGKDLTWHTPEGIAVKPLYTADDVTVDPGLPGFAPFTRGVRASMYAGRRLDYPAIRGLFDGRGVECVLSPQSGGGAKRSFGRVRSGDASRV